MNRNDTLYAIDHDLNYLQHEGKAGMKWYQHKFGVWQKQAVYAHGMDDPNAKEQRKADKTVTKQAKNDARMFVLESNSGITNTKAYRSIAGKSRKSVTKQYNDYLKRGRGSLSNTNLSDHQKKVYTNAFNKYMNKYGEMTKLNYGNRWNFARDGMYSLKNG